MKNTNQPFRNYHNPWTAGSKSDHQPQINATHPCSHYKTVRFFCLLLSSHLVCSCSTFKNRRQSQLCSHRHFLTVSLPQSLLLIPMYLYSAFKYEENNAALSHMSSLWINLAFIQCSQVKKQNYISRFAHACRLGKTDFMRKVCGAEKIAMPGRHDHVTRGSRVKHKTAELNGSCRLCHARTSQNATWTLSADVRD